MKNLRILKAILIGILATAFVGKPKSTVKLHKTFTNAFAYIPQSSSNLEGGDGQIVAFFASKTEVSNSQYRQFLAAMDTADVEIQEAIAIHDDNWTKDRWNSEPYAQYYSSHEAYNEYPVVNITHEAAQLYCAWLTAYFKTQDIGLPENMELSFRLPEREEWLHAANGGGQGPYAWGGPYLRNKQGCELANFLAYGPENISFDPETETYHIVKLPVYMGVPGDMNRNADVTAPIRSYAPNGYELYNMNGNVAEMLSEPGIAAGGSWASPGYDVRNESLMTYEPSSPCVGFRPIAVLSTR